MEKLVKGINKLGITLTEQQAKQFQLYYEELIDWNQRVNLTSIVDYEGVQIKHFLDSLTIVLAFNLEELTQISHWRVIDVGTGAGLPGIPLKIVFPQIKLTLLDSVTKKTTFLNHLIGQLKLNGVEIITGRAEDVAHKPQYREQFSLVLSRALAQLSSLVELTLPFCQIGGVFIAPKKGDLAAEIHQAASAIDILGGKLREVKKINLKELDERRYLVIIDKVSLTPNNYPRRAGVPVRRPILATS